MRFAEPLGLSGITLRIPSDSLTAEEALTSGLIDEETVQELGYASLPVETGASPPEMAVLAARTALTGTDPGEVGLLLHAWMHYQGHDLWSPAHYIADRTGAHASVPLGIQQVCNGGAAAIETAAAHLLADPDLDLALVTTADRFPDSAFDRWRGDYGIAYGDGATALLLHPADRPSTQLALHAVASVAAPSLERMHRGRDPFATVPRSVSRRVDVRRTKKAFLEEEGMEAFGVSSRQSLHTVVRRCLAGTGISGEDTRLRHVALPRLGRHTLTEGYAKPLAEVTTAVPLMLGADTGHLGAGDASAALASLVGILDPGEYALVISAGAGFTWSCLLVSGW